ncbi:hypothetical protein PK35_01590 [Tamlana nanhaiensis]|uniref:Secreted protein n=2 Tax=Neotamlana nanhaiensis TaxID=1382798 RepID=A0A0D7W5W6_9FLAO|nr:hypothetical protein PK35_01590 [Tamlana nanhaiensis]
MALLMAFVVLITTMSFTVNMHYCGETLVETTVFQKAEGCGMEMQKPSTDNCAVTTKSCCADKKLTIEGQNELQHSVDKITFDQQVFIASFIYTYIKLFEGERITNTSFDAYKPPLVSRQIFKLDETYLI